MIIKSLRNLILTGVLLCGAWTGEGANYQHVTFVNNYGSLNSYVGQDGLFYVREAGKGQNADPTVRSGWACYVWDTRTRAWKNIAKEDVFRLCNVDFSTYLTLANYLADITPVKTTLKAVNTRSLTNAIDIVSLKLNDQRLEARIDSLTNQPGTVVADVTLLKSQMATQQVITSTLKIDVATNTFDIGAIKSRLAVHDLQLSALEEYKLTNDANIVRLDEKNAQQDVVITNNAAIAKSYTDGATNATLTAANAKALEYAGVAKEAAQDYADAKDTELRSDLNATIVSATNAAVNAAVAVAAEDATTKATAAKESAISIADTAAQGYAATAKSEAITIAASDATDKANAAKTAAAADATEKATFANTNAIAVARGYTDEKSATAESNAKSYADGLKSTLDATIAGNKTDIENKLTTATTTLNTSIEGVKTRVTNAEGRLDNHDSQISTLEGKIAGVYHFKGTVATTNDLPATAENADVYYVSDVKESYAYLVSDGSGSWKPIGKSFDLSAYKVWSETKTYVDAADGALDTRITGVSDNLTSLSSTVAANKTELDTKITVVSNKVTTLESKVTSDKAELEGKITAADTKAQQGVDNAAAALARANEVEADLTVVINSNKVELTSAIATAKQEAKTYADTQDTAVKDELNPLITEAKSAALTADAKAVDAKAFAVAASNNVLTAAKAYTDSKDPGSKSYVQEQIAAVSNNVIKIAAADATTKSNTAESNAKTYAKTLTTTVSNAFVAADTKLKTDLTATITTKETALKNQIVTGDSTTYVSSSNTTETLIQSKVIDKWTPTVRDPEEESEDTYSLNVAPNSVTTVLPTKYMNEGSEMNVICSGTNERNFTLYIPNEPQLLVGLPITIETAFPSTVKAVYAKRKKIYKLPAKVVSEQPYEKLTVLTINELDDGTDWTPVVTNIALTCTNTAAVGISPKFVCDKQCHSLEGINLHGGTVFQIVYPTNLVTGATVTNDFMTIESGSETMEESLYYYTMGDDYTPSPAMAIDGTTLKSWYEIIYKTVNGTATIPRQEVDFSEQ